MSNNAHELSNRLLNALDNSYNVVDMHAVNEIISILEKFNITKELLETTRLGKHVNELRRKTTEPSLARRAKVLVKRWRDLVIPTVASPGHTGSNRSSAERQVRRLGGTPLTSPALSRQVVSPAVPSPRPASRPTWGGYESDSQDVILVDDDPPSLPPPLLPAMPLPNALPVPNALHKPITPPVKRPPSPEPLNEEKKAKRDKKPKKRRGHGRAGTGTETPAPAPSGAAGAGAAGAGAGAAAWGGRNGTHSERRRNGCRRDVVEPYAALVNRMPPVGAKKVKTTMELLEQIQSRSQPAAELAAPDSPDVMLIEPSQACPIKVDSPLRNGRSTPRVATPPPASAPASPLPPLEEEREYPECTCGEEPSEECPAAWRRRTAPLHVRALHAGYLPGVNGTRAPLQPHRFAVRPLADPDRPGLFTSVVPLYKYSDYADDTCVKNMSRVPLCESIPWTEFAPPPPSPPPPRSPPPMRPYPLDEPVEIKTEPMDEDDIKTELEQEELRPVEAEMVGVPNLEPSERLKAPLLLAEDDPQPAGPRDASEAPAPAQFATDIQDHRTVERTKAEPLDGSALHRLCCDTIAAIPYDYSQMSSAPVVTLPDQEPEALEVLEAALAQAREETSRDELGRPGRPANFAEWHECVRLGDLIALPYVVID